MKTPHPTDALSLARSCEGWRVKLRRLGRNCNRRVSKAEAAVRLAAPSLLALYLIAYNTVRKFAP